MSDAAKDSSLSIPSKDKQDTPSLEKVLNTFINHISSLKITIPHITIHLLEREIEQRKRLLALCESEKGEELEVDGKKMLKMSPKFFATFRPLNQEIDRLEIARKLIPQGFVVSMVSQYDVLLGGVIRCLYYIRPELLNASEKNLSFAQLLKLNSIENARDYLLEKEIESVLRTSHTEQIEWLEKKAGMKLREGLDEWPAFIELTERRNLFVHCDGVVSSQYMSVCAEHSAALSETINTGTRLDVTLDYILSAYHCVFQIGVKLGQVIWRKHKPEELEKADMSLASICDNLLRADDYRAAIEMLNFATLTLKKHSSEELKRHFVINRALAYKMSGDNEKCKEVIDGYDWSACNLRFKLALAILVDNFQTAAKIMHTIGRNGDVKESQYTLSPLYHKFRQSQEFLKAYAEVFGKPYTIIQEVPQISADIEVAEPKENGKNEKVPSAKDPQQ